MTERPILFSAPMVRAILEGRKTMTRRVVKITHRTPGLALCLEPKVGGPRPLVAAELCPYGQPGDRLWVRETWGVGSRPDPWGGYEGIEYRADQDGLEDDELLPCHKVKTPDDICLSDYRSGWHPSIHMPRWASRITLEITEVRVERLQEIGEADAMAEGVSGWVHDERCETARDGFRVLWESIHGSDSWSANPWVWVVEFRRVTP